MREFLVETQLLVSVIGVCIMIISFFMIRTLRSLDKNQADLYEKYDNHESRLSHIEGEHKVFTQKGRH